MPENDSNEGCPDGRAACWMLTAWIDMGNMLSPHLQQQMLKLNSNQDVLWDATNYLDQGRQK